MVFSKIFFIGAKSEYGIELKTNLMIVYYTLSYVGEHKEPMIDYFNYARMALLGIVSLHQVADNFKLNDAERNEFIQEYEVYVRKCASDRNQIDVYAESISFEFEDLYQQSLQRKKEKDLYDNSNDFVNAVGVSSSMEIPVAPAALLAYSLISLLKNPKTRNSKEAWLNTSTQLLSNTHGILKDTALTQLATLADVSITGVVNLSISFIREYQYQQRESKKSAVLEKTISSVEHAYFLLHQAYDLVALHYKNTLNVLKDDGKKDSPLYQKSLDEWRLAERYFHTQIQQQQQHIAIASALLQEEQSKRRIDRVNDALQTAFSAVNLAGPPGLVAGVLIKAAASVGATIGYQMVAESARFNNAVITPSEVILITDKDSLVKAREQLSRSVNPVIALSGPILETRNVMGMNVDRALYTDSSLAEKLVATLDGRRSCSFGLSKAISDIPVIPVVAEGKNFSNDPVVKQQGKDQLKNLLALQKDLISEQNFLDSLASKLMKQHKPWPHVTNFVELIQSLTDVHEAIKAQKNLVHQQMGSAYCSNPESEGMKLLAELGHCERVYTANLSNLKQLVERLDKTPHSKVFRQATQGELIDTYAQDHKAYHIFLDDIALNIDAITSLVDSCEQLGKGRHIRNIGEAIAEIDRHLSILERAYEKAAGALPIDALKKLKVCQHNLDVLANKSAYLDKKRLEYLATNPAQEHSARSKYQEYSSLEDGLLSYGDNLPEIHLDLPYQTSAAAREAGESIFQQMEVMQHDLFDQLEYELDEATPVNRDQLDLTDAILSPHRAFIGWSKHSEMAQAVESKITVLVTEKKIKNLQIMPLQAVTEELLASCQGRHDKFKNVIEGLKTEMQWLSKVQEVCAAQGVNILNIDKLKAYYVIQLQILTAAFHNKSTVLGNTRQATNTFAERFSSMKDKLINLTHEHQSEEQLRRADKAASTIYEKSAPKTEEDIDYLSNMADALSESEQLCSKIK